jgi:GTP cyclohydrolase I
MNQQKIEEATRLLLEGLEVDPSDHNFADTPRRVAKAYAELFSPPDIDIPVFDEKYTDMVMMRNHVFYTMCPHHLLPVKLQATVAYFPRGKVIGASKLIRIMHDVNRCPMTQEALTNAIIQRIEQLTHGENHGVAVFMKGHHGCFAMRGVQSHDAEMITWALHGRFETDATARDAFFRLVV